MLIGTPGRIADILKMDPELGGISMPELDTLILDEADRLLDDGFWPEIQNIMSFLPRRRERDRQTLLFSATAPAEVMPVVRNTLKRDYKFVKTVRDDEVPTHMKVPQKVVWMNGLENAMPTVLEIAKTYMHDDSQSLPFKAIVYFNTGAEVKLAREFFDNLRFSEDQPIQGVQTYGLYSGLTQGRRNFNSDGFRAARSAILLSSSVTARGMDFPNVTHVIQVGMPATRPEYIHRMGRTGRADKSGQSWLLVLGGFNHITRNFRERLGDLPIETANIEVAKVDMTDGDEVQRASPASVELINQVKKAMKSVSYMTRAEAFRTVQRISGRDLGITRDAQRKIQNLLVYGYGISNADGVSDSPSRSPFQSRIPRFQTRPSRSRPPGPRFERRSPLFGSNRQSRSSRERFPWDEGW